MLHQIDGYDFGSIRTICNERFFNHLFNPSYALVDQQTFDSILNSIYPIPAYMSSDLIKIKTLAD